MQKRRYYYFAYGSNMSAKRMLDRCPTAMLFGVGTIRGYRRVERLYADIERADGRSVDGVVWTVTDDDIAILDACEGVAGGVYQRRLVMVQAGEREICAYVYEMTRETKAVRSHRFAPQWYLDVCATGARENGIRFTMEE